MGKMCDCSQRSLKRFSIYSRLHQIDFGQNEFFVHFESKQHEPRLFHLLSALQSHFKIPKDQLRVFYQSQRLDLCSSETFCELGIPDGARIHVHTTK